MSNEGITIQPAGFLLELSPDWLILRASENIHKFLGEYHVSVIGEPLANFTLAQPLHDLRNSLSRQRSSTGVARAYRVRLIDEPRYFDVAFQLVDSRILLEGVASSEAGYGEALGSVSRLIDGLQVADRIAMLESAARRMRALTGFDRVTLSLFDKEVESSRNKIPKLTVTGGLPAIVADAASEPVPLYPRNKENGKIGQALLRSPTPQQLNELHAAGFPSALNIPLIRGGQAIGSFRCDNRAVRSPSFELHAAAELFAQVFAMLLPESDNP